MSTPSPFPLGSVSLVGAGPGDPELITLRGYRRLQQAEVLLYDNLVSPEIVDFCPSTAERIYVGKSAGKHSLKQLVNAASNQREALEEHFAKGKSNRKDAGARYRPEPHAPSLGTHIWPPPWPNVRRYRRGVADPAPVARP